MKKEKRELVNVVSIYEERIKGHKGIDING